MSFIYDSTVPIYDTITAGKKFSLRVGPGEILHLTRAHATLFECERNAAAGSYAMMLYATLGDKQQPLAKLSAKYNSVPLYQLILEADYIVETADDNPESAIMISGLLSVPKVGEGLGRVLATTGYFCTKLTPMTRFHGIKLNGGKLTKFVLERVEVLHRPAGSTITVSARYNEGTVNVARQVSFFKDGYPDVLHLFNLYTDSLSFELELDGHSQALLEISGRMLG